MNLKGCGNPVTWRNVTHQASETQRLSYSGGGIGMSALGQERTYALQ
jgi:hypothetical protein